MIQISPGILALAMALTILLTAVIVPYILAINRDWQAQRARDDEAADEIRRQCIENDNADNDAMWKERQSAELAKMMLSDAKDRAQVAMPPPLALPDAPRLEDGARWLDME